MVLFCMKNPMAWVVIYVYLGTCHAVVKSGALRRFWISPFRTIINLSPSSVIIHVTPYRNKLAEREATLVRARTGNISTSVTKLRGRVPTSIWSFIGYATMYPEWRGYSCTPHFSACQANGYRVCAPAKVGVPCPVVYQSHWPRHKHKDSDSGSSKQWGLSTASVYHLGTATTTTTITATTATITTTRTKTTTTTKTTTSSSTSTSTSTTIHCVTKPKSHKVCLVIFCSRART